MGTCKGATSDMFILYHSFFFAPTLTRCIIDLVEVRIWSSNLNYAKVAYCTETKWANHLVLHKSAADVDAFDSENVASPVNFLFSPMCFMLYNCDGVLVLE
jgi:hypothetical protein